MTNRLRLKIMKRKPGLINAPQDRSTTENRIKGGEGYQVSRLKRYYRYISDMNGMCVEYLRDGAGTVPVDTVPIVRINYLNSVCAHANETIFINNARPVERSSIPCVVASTHSASASAFRDIKCVRFPGEMSARL